MDNAFIEAQGLIAQAREALRRGDKLFARRVGRQAARLAPELEDAWLVLAAAEPDPERAMAYARRSLELHPESARARRAVEWAADRLKQAEALRDSYAGSPQVAASQLNAAAPPAQQHAYQTVVAAPQLPPGGRNWLAPALLTGALCMLLGFFALFALTSPAVAGLVSSLGAPQENLWAPVDISKPELTPVQGNSSVVGQAADTPTSAPTPVPSDIPTQAPDEAPTDPPAVEETAVPAATETPGSMVMEIVEETPVTEYVPSEPAISMGDGVRWIDVDLTNQMVYAYEGGAVVNSFLVSTGTWLTPTVTGKYKIYVKVRVQDMTGPGYHLRDVPYVMFFYGDYGLHGTYWHNNFGTPMSRGCVNLTIDDAAWLFGWASVGTVVNVHY